MVGSKVYHVDVSNQISNSWYKDSIIGLYAEDKSLLRTIRIPTRLKLRIKDKLKEYPEPYIEGHLLSYLLFRCCMDKEETIKRSLIERTLLCPDLKPIKLYMKCLQKCFSCHGKNDFFMLLKIKPKTHKEKSKAHKKVRKIFQRKKRASYEFKIEDTVLFFEYFKKQSIRKLEG